MHAKTSTEMTKLATKPTPAKTGPATTAVDATTKTKATQFAFAAVAGLDDVCMFASGLQAQALYFMRNTNKIEYASIFLAKTCLQNWFTAPFL